ncbi:hypothetical protein R6Q57_003278 [Mikania cordata]
MYFLRANPNVRLFFAAGLEKSHQIVDGCHISWFLAAQGYLPMVQTTSEGGELNHTTAIVEDEGLSDDDDEDEDTNTLDEEKEINDDKEDSDVDIVWLHMLDDMEEMVGIDLLMATRVEFRLTATQPRKVRGRGKNKNLLEKFAINNNKSLELDLDPKGGTHKFVGENASLFIRCISNEVARVPFHYPSWDRVPEHDKLRIYRTLHHYFDLQSWLGTSDWDGIRAGINEDCARRYRDRKNELKRHFDAYGGYDNMRDTGTSSMLKDWKKMHTKKGGGWVNETAKDDWERLEEEAAQMHKESGTEQIDEEECLSRVLGDRRGWNRGIGRRLRNIVPDVSCVSNSQSQLSDMQETICLMNENMKRMQDEIDALKSKTHGTSRDSDED